MKHHLDPHDDYITEPLGTTPIQTTPNVSNSFCRENVDEPIHALVTDGPCLYCEDGQSHLISQADERLRLRVPSVKTWLPNPPPDRNWRRSSHLHPPTNQTQDKAYSMSLLQSRLPVLNSHLERLHRLRAEVERIT